MTCQRCGEAANGRLCKECELVEAQRGRGTPVEIREREEADDE